MRGLIFCAPEKLQLVYVVKVNAQRVPSSEYLDQTAEENGCELSQLHQNRRSLQEEIRRVQEVQEDKLYNDKSGNDIKITCRFYDELDKESGNSLHVKKVVHADAVGSDNPCPVEDESVFEKSLDTTENTETIDGSNSKITSGVEGPVVKPPPKEKPTSMKQGQDMICSILEIWLVLLLR
ncbi:hypothetical protein R1sor_001010 [Riccia sorocarpa]|uniref:Uncharacterized protein n=1 Tax=Riccia sorocarpa TaxID=122646 RepID=A0ABD3GVM0_9MARC